METNRDKLVKMAVNASVDHPRINGYWTGYDGKGRVTMGTGGITYSHAVGDNCMDIAGDHIEPGVTMANSSPKENMAVQTYACVGNEVRVLNGEARGARGYVTGTHGGVNHTMAYFDAPTLEKMDGTERFLIKAHGQGLKLKGHDDIFLMNLDPDLFEALPIQEVGDAITFPVAYILPSHMMGAGLGESTLMSGDIDIMTQDRAEVKKLGLDQLRFGDFVAIQDLDSTYGPHRKKGAVSIGVVVHSDSFSAGHGPGVTMLATSKEGKIQPVLDRNANLKTYMDTVKR